MKKGWEVKRLGELCGFIRGPFGGSLKKNIFKETGYAVYEQSHAIYDQFTDIRYFIDQEKFNEMKRFELHPGELIMSCSGTMGKVAIVPENIPRGIINQALLKLSPNKTLSNRYLKLWMESIQFQESLQNHSQGAAIQNVASVQILKGIEVSLPSLPEQRRIVAILDEVFDSITRAKDIAERNLRNARELFESYLQNVFVNTGEGWQKKSLHEAFVIRPPKQEARDRLRDNDLVSFVPMEDLGILSKNFIPQKEKQLHEVIGSYTYFSDGDVLMAKITPCFENGKLGAARQLKNGTGFGSSEFIVFRTLGMILPDFLYYFLSRQQFRDEGEKVMLGAVGHKRVSKDFIDSYLIPYPDLNEQQRIVSTLDNISSEVKKLESNYQQKLSDLEELKKSVLQKAFNGELITD